MKTVHRIVDLAEELSDVRVNFNVDVNHFQTGQTITISLQMWAADHSSIQQSRVFYDYSPEELLAMLEQVKEHGFRGES